MDDGNPLHCRKIQSLPGPPFSASWLILCMRYPPGPNFHGFETSFCNQLTWPFLRVYPIAVLRPMAKLHNLAWSDLRFNSSPISLILNSFKQLLTIRDPVRNPWTCWCLKFPSWSTWAGGKGFKGDFKGVAWALKMVEGFIRDNCMGKVWNIPMIRQCWWCQCSILMPMILVKYSWWAKVLMIGQYWHWPWNFAVPFRRKAKTGQFIASKLRHASVIGFATSGQQVDRSFHLWHYGDRGLPGPPLDPLL